MNLFIEKYMGLLVILCIPLCTLFVLSLGGLALYLTERIKRDRVRLTIVLLSFAVGFGIFFYGTACLYLHYNNGKLVDMFVFRSAGQTRMLVWTEVEDIGGAGMITLYANRLKLYDPASGKLLRQMFLNRRTYWNDYTIYGPFADGRAWSYSSDTGLRLLDLWEGKILLDEKEILKRLPRLGERIRIFSGRAYDPTTDAFFVTTPDGNVHRILPDELGRSDRKVAWLDTEPYRHFIDLPEDLKDAHVYTSWWSSSDDTRLVLMTIRGYTLTGLRLDAQGRVSGRIDYFD